MRAASEEMCRGVDMRARVGAKVDHRNVRRITMLQTEKLANVDARIAGIGRSVGRECDADIVDRHVQLTLKTRA